MIENKTVIGDLNRLKMINYLFQWVLAFVWSKKAVQHLIRV